MHNPKSHSREWFAFARRYLVKHEYRGLILPLFKVGIHKVSLVYGQLALGRSERRVLDRHSCLTCQRMRNETGMRDRKTARKTRNASGRRKHSRKRGGRTWSSVTSNASSHSVSQTLRRRVASCLRQKVRDKK